MAPPQVAMVPAATCDESSEGEAAGHSALLPYLLRLGPHPAAPRGSRACLPFTGQESEAQSSRVQGLSASEGQSWGRTSLSVPRSLPSLPSPAWQLSLLTQGPSISWLRLPGPSQRRQQLLSIHLEESPGDSTLFLPNTFRLRVL